ncbi:MAG TPA: flagellar motor protein MotB [Mycobacteriales bacterium]|jgi:chemotaxis protein MotB
MVKPGRARKRPEEDQVNHERWMVSYADMLTLLMVLFIVLFAISQVDQKKFDQLKNGIAGGFGAPSVTTGGTGPVSDSGDTTGTLTVGPPPNLMPQQPTDTAVDAAARAADRARQSELAELAKAEANNLLELRDAMRKALERQGLKDNVKFEINERGLVVSILTDEVIFTGDSALLRRGGARVLDAIGPALRATPNGVIVEGHTNHLGVANPLYPTLWELSTARASSVVRYLVSEGIDPKRLEAAGFGKERPLYPPTDPRAITQNRRVEVVVLSNLPSEARSLLPAAATGR